ncbi:MAG: hypothetical protein KAT34_17500, partial [Candidatus Aminicenantes bacterium]|nr:hypothetical protein [Candidatus Aminicenantes bacterium]
MDPITLFLLGFPLSVVAGLTSNKLKKWDFSLTKTNLGKILIESLLKAFKNHRGKIKNSGDQQKEQILQTLQDKIVYKNKKKILEIFHPGISKEKKEEFLKKIDSKEFHAEVAQRFLMTFSDEHDSKILQKEEMANIVVDCLAIYRNYLLAKMDVKEIILEILKQEFQQNVDISSISTEIDALKSKNISKADLSYHFEKLEQSLQHIIIELLKKKPPQI